MAKQHSSLGLDELAVWSKKLAELFDHCDTDHYGDCLFEAISTVVPHDMAMLVAYGRDAKPVLIHDTFNHEEAKRGLRNYINDTYTLNPVYEVVPKSRTVS